jgi:hypothetical protein
MEMRRHSSHTAGQDFSAFSDKFFQQIWILVVDGLGGNVDPAARHDSIGAPEIGSAFGVFWFHYLFHLPMKSAALQERIVFFLFQSAWSVEALFVTRGDITRSRFAFRFRLRALNSNDIPRHDS